MFSINDLLIATGGRLLQGDRGRRIAGISINSKLIRPKEAFVAIAGEKFDGHDFANDVAGKKAGALIVSKDIRISDPKIAVIRVKDTVRALGRIALFHRRRFRLPVVAITGSAGKTTTKEMLLAVMKRQYRVLGNAGTENNHIGVPLTLLKLKPSHEAAVIEFGTNQPGDIRWLTEITEPTIAVFTNIGESHLEKLRNCAGVFKEKFELGRRMPKGGALIFNNDDRFLTRIANLKGSHAAVRFGLERPADFKVKEWSLSRRGTVEFTLTNRQKFVLGVPSKDHIYNALAAIAVGRRLKIPFAVIAKALKRFRFPSNRLNIQSVSGIWIVNDTYNANPVSVRSAIETLNSFQTQGRRIFICADMLELGTQSERLHRKIGEAVGYSRIDVFLTVGDKARHMSETARSKGALRRVDHCATLDELHKQLISECHRGDVVLVKGSRGMKMERTIDFLTRKLRT